MTTASPHSIASATAIVSKRKDSFYRSGRTAKQRGEVAAFHW
jgi:hypothetical protein